MKVLSFSYCYPRPGRPTWGIFVRQRLEAMAARAELEVVSPVPDFPVLGKVRGRGLPKTHRWGGLTVHRPRFFCFPGLLKDLDGWLYYRGLRKWLRRQVERFDPDILDAHFVWPDGVGVALLARELDLPYSVTLRGKIYPCLKIQAQCDAVTDALRGADAVISVSGPMAEEAAELGVARRRLHVIPNGVDTGQFHPRDRDECRRRLGLDVGGRLIVTIAHLGPRKGHEETIRALASLPEDVRLLIVGPDPEGGRRRRGLMEEAERCGAAGRVGFAGGQPYEKIPLYLSAADASVLASHREGCPNVVLESLAAGTPVVATAVGAVEDLLAGAEGGRVVPPHDAGRLAAAVAEVLETDWDAERVRRAPAVRPWADVAGEVLRVLERARPEPHRAGCSGRTLMRQLRPHRPDALRVERRRRVLAICGDTQVGLWMARSLARNGLKVFPVVRGPDGQAAHSIYASGAWMTAAGPDAPPFADQVLQLARRLEVGSVMPISEGYHQALIDARDRFEPDIHVFSPDADRFAKATDKDFMHSLCRELGVPVARGATLDRLLSGRVELKLPLVLRTARQNDPAAGRTPWKAAYARDEAELERLAEQVRDMADNVLVQEYHPGAEDHVQVLMHDGRAVMTGEYIGEHHMPLAGGVTVQRVSCRHEPVTRDAVRLLEALGWEGIAGVQFHYDPDTGRYIFLEINPRFIGGLPTVVMAGFEAPFMLWQSHFEPEALRPRPYRLGLRSRILGGDANWMLAMARGDELPPGQRRLGRLSAAGRFLWNFGPWTRDDSFLLADPKPFAVDLVGMAGRLGARTHDIIGNPDGQERTR